MRVDADDDGSGLARAGAQLDGSPAGEIALDPVCGAAPPPTEGCTKVVRGAPLRIDLSRAAVGDHRLQVWVTDGAGNRSVLFDGVVAVAPPDPTYSSTVQFVVGDPSRRDAIDTVPPRMSVGTAGCAKPRLSVALASRPLRVSGGRSVLRAGKRYRFRGRLTCVVDGQRRSAQAGTRIELLRKVGRRTRRVTGATTRAGGRITKTLSYGSSCTLIFRHRAQDGQGRVAIRLLVSRSRR